MSSLTRWVLAHKRTVVIAWILLTFAGIAASGPATENLEAEFSVPDKEGWETNELIAANYQGTGGDTAPLMRPYLPPDYRADAAGHDIRATVYMEAEWDPADPIGETRFVSGLAVGYGLPNAMVAQAWLHHPDVGTVLAAQAGFPLVRSVRHKPGGPATPQAARDGKRTLMSDERWRRG